MLFNAHGVIFKNHFYSREWVTAEIDQTTRYLSTLKNPNTPPFIFLYAENHIRTIICYYATINAGLSCVLIDPNSKPLELKDLRHTTPPLAEIHVSDNNIEIQRAETYDPWIPLNDPSTIVYTAGEDGYLKAPILTPGNILSDAQTCVPPTGTEETSVVCALLPFHHLFGLITGVIAPSIAGATILIEDPSQLRSIKDITGRFVQYGITHLYTIPSIYYLLFKVPEFNDAFKTIRYMIAGGHSLSESLYESSMKKFGKPIHQGYGLTEASPICTYNNEHAPYDSAGPSLECCTVQIFDEHDNPVPIGQKGEVCIQGTNVMQGYYNNPEGTNRTLRNKWLHTGDLGRLDKDGHVYLTGLKKSMFNVMGMKVYPAHVKRLMQSCSMIKDVHLSAKESELEGHIVEARIKLNSPQNQDAVKKWCRANLSMYRIPRRIQWEA